MGGPCSTNGREEEHVYIMCGNARGILERWDGVMWTGLVWLRIGTGGVLVNSGTESSGSMKCWETIEWPSI
jgi:hypothetical protein